MQITFLGTAAAEGYPNPFCHCANCEQARALGGLSLRKRSSALIDDLLLIDLGPDLITASSMHGPDLAKVRFCLQTHSHADHLDPSLFLIRMSAYGVDDAPRLQVYASAASIERVARLLEPDLAPANLRDPSAGDQFNLAIHSIAPFETFAAGRYRVTAIPANHDKSVQPLLYAIEADECSIFYGTDTGPFHEDTWEALRRRRFRFDLVVLDHTYGVNVGASDHLNARQFVEHVTRMRQEGLLADGARLFATHIAHDGNPVHPKLVKLAARHGYEVAYDGLSVEVNGMRAGDA
jgi:phosphoribosyl 1,2-cyclic phosphate phosphodiesterase